MFARVRRWPKSFGTFAFFFILVNLLKSVPPSRERWAALQQLCSSAESRGFRYGISLDAGSTGSRVHVYRFSTCGRKVLFVDSEVFEQTKPGLSSMADEPADAKDSVARLLDVAKQSIPEEFHKCTPVSLKATAGLRLVSQEKADRVLAAVRSRYVEGVDGSVSRR